jgi:HAD superfamily hydrolase (TIGR01490 family)|tara:strand:- start:2554 stop:3216 length:663 start_codon:yes stop_codon:yes gene_type:complete
LNLAIFDLDNTLLDGDSDYNWGLFLIQEGLVDQKMHEDSNKKFYADYNAGKLDIYKFTEFQFKFFKNNSRKLTDELLVRYIDEVASSMITKKARELVTKHRNNGDKLLIITATNSYITKPIGKLLGIDDLIGTDLDEANGEFTGKVKGIPSFKEGKIERLNLWLKQKKLTLREFEKTFFYSDSQNDLPLLRLVSNPVAANPDDVLKKEASEKDWPIIFLK